MCCYKDLNFALNIYILYDTHCVNWPMQISKRTVKHKYEEEKKILIQIMKGKANKNKLVND